MEDDVESFVDARFRHLWAVVYIAREFEHHDGYRGEEGGLEGNIERSKSKAFSKKMHPQ